MKMKISGRILGKVNERFALWFTRKMREFLLTKPKGFRCITPDGRRIYFLTDDLELGVITGRDFRKMSEKEVRDYFVAAYSAWILSESLRKLKAGE